MESRNMLVDEVEKDTRGRADYALLEVMGDPGSEVFRARTRDGRSVVLRFWHGDSELETRNAIELLVNAMRVQHPMLAAVYGCERFPDGSLRVVSEYVPGRSLDAWLGETGRPPLAIGVDFVRRLALALSDAHRFGVTHHALYPGNIVVSEPDTRPQGRIAAKLLDLGVTRGMRDATRFEAAHFIAPEALAHELASPAQTQRVDVRMNVYSCGCLLHYLSTGQPPYQSDSLENLVALHASGRPALPARLNPRIPPDLERVICQALDLDPKRRTPDMGSLARNLSHVEQQWRSSTVRRRAEPPPLPVRSDVPVPQPSAASGGPRLAPAIAAALALRPVPKRTSSPPGPSPRTRGARGRDPIATPPAASSAASQPRVSDCDAASSRSKSSDLPPSAAASSGVRAAVRPPKPSSDDIITIDASELALLTAEPLPAELAHAADAIVIEPAMTAIEPAKVVADVREVETSVAPTELQPIDVVPPELALGAVTLEPAEVAIETPVAVQTAVECGSIVPATATETSESGAAELSAVAAPSAARTHPERESLVTPVPAVVQSVSGVADASATDFASAVEAVAAELAQAAPLTAAERESPVATPSAIEAPASTVAEILAADVASVAEASAIDAPVSAPLLAAEREPFAAAAMSVELLTTAVAAVSAEPQGVVTAEFIDAASASGEPGRVADAAVAASVVISPVAAPAVDASLDASVSSAARASRADADVAAPRVVEGREPSVVVSEILFARNSLSPLEVTGRRRSDGLPRRVVTDVLVPPRVAPVPALRRWRWGAAALAGGAVYAVLMTLSSRPEPAVVATPLATASVARAPAAEPLPAPELPRVDPEPADAPPAAVRAPTAPAPHDSKRHVVQPRVARQASPSVAAPAASDPLDSIRVELPTKPQPINIGGAPRVVRLEPVWSAPNVVAFSELAGPQPSAARLSAAGKVRTDSVAVQGSLTVAQARRAIERISPQLGQCYVDHGPSSVVSLQVELIIDDVGRVRNLQVRGAAPALAECVVQVSRKLMSGLPYTGAAKMAWNLRLE
jgi:serine/threonine protein kinase